MCWYAVVFAVVVDFSVVLRTVGNWQDESWPCHSGRCRLTMSGCFDVVNCEVSDHRRQAVAAALDDWQGESWSCQ